jgi:hypothetical protein
MYPTSWHAVKTNYTPDLKRKAPHTTRTQTPVKYHLIDLGISRQYVNRADALTEPVIFGGDKSPPEHQGSNAFYSDPFPTDVYYLGNMVREHFIHVRFRHSYVFMPLISTSRRKTLGLSSWRHWSPI